MDLCSGPWLGLVRRRGQLDIRGRRQAKTTDAARAAANGAAGKKVGLFEGLFERVRERLE
jgi:hypothetical protein